MRTSSGSSAAPWRTLLVIWLSCAQVFAVEAGTRGPARVHVTVIGDTSDESTLGSRIQSLFDTQTEVEIASAEQLMPAAVLDPEIPETAYLWIRLRADRHARIYVAVRDEAGHSTRYLFRDVRLPSLPSEIAQETLAQVAHSTLQALLAREQQTPRHDVVSQLRNDTSPEPETTTTRAAQKVSPKPLGPKAHRGSPANSKGISGQSNVYSLGIYDALRTATDLGWTQEPGAFFSIAWGGRLVTRVLLGYSIPHDFDTRLARVELTGASGEMRAGWSVGASDASRLCLEIGLGSSFVQWKGQPLRADVTGFSGLDRRDYAVGSLLGDTPIGPVRVGVRFDLRVPFRATHYDARVGQGTEPLVESWLTPGIALEVAIPLTRTRRDLHDGQER